MSDGYDPAKDAHDSYFAAIEAKRRRGDANRRPWNDHDVCKAVRAHRAVLDVAALTLAQERGLVEPLPGAGLALTRKGAELLDGIEPTACSGWHVGGAAPVGRPRRS